MSTPATKGEDSGTISTKHKIRGTQQSKPGQSEVQQWPLHPPQKPRSQVNYRVHWANHEDAQRIAGANAGSPEAVGLGSATCRDLVARKVSKEGR